MSVPTHVKTHMSKHVKTLDISVFKISSENVSMDQTLGKDTLYIFMYTFSGLKVHVIFSNAFTYK